MHNYDILAHQITAWREENYPAPDDPAIAVKVIVTHNLA
jgi:hypothetical protein